MLFEKWSGSFKRLTRYSRSGKHSRLGHVIGTRGMSRGRSLRSIHFIGFLTTWVTVQNLSKCVFALISMLGRVKNSHYSSCLLYFTKQNKNKLKADRRLIQVPNGRLFIVTSTTHNSLHFSPQATVPCQQNNNLSISFLN